MLALVLIFYSKKLMTKKLMNTYIQLVQSMTIIITQKQWIEQWKVVLMMQELVIIAPKPNSSQSSLGRTVLILGLITGRRVGVSTVRPEVVVNLPMRAIPSLLRISNIVGLSLLYNKGCGEVLVRVSVPTDIKSPHMIV